MNEELFWSVIEESKVEGLNRIGSRLSNSGKEEILEFHHTLLAMLAKACIFPLLAANFVIESYVSDDGFRTFRGWLILQGHRNFSKTINDPEFIADWLDFESIDKIEDGEYLLSIAEDVYNGDDFYERVVTVPEPLMNQEWPDSKSEYRARWPKLVDKFWNQEMIDKMHH